MHCALEWDTLSADLWSERFATIRRSTLLQSEAYAAATCPASGQRPRRALIRIDGADAGLVQIQEAALFRRTIHALVLDRGPLWFDGFGSSAHFKSFFQRLTKDFPARFGRKRRLIAEMPARFASEVFADVDAVALPDRPGYQTIWLDLTKDEDALRKAMKAKWRNMLNKAEKLDLSVDWDWSGLTAGAFVAHYANDQREKGYGGATPEALHTLAKAFQPSGQAGIAVAFSGDVPAAGMLVLCHGNSATYQAGWVLPEGRKTAANHLLIWQMMLALKARGITDLDLGGINDTDAIGIRRFKEGLGGQCVTLPCQHR